MVRGFYHERTATHRYSITLSFVLGSSAELRYGSAGGSSLPGWPFEAGIIRTGAERFGAR